MMTLMTVKGDHQNQPFVMKLDNRKHVHALMRVVSMNIEAGGSFSHEPTSLERCSKGHVAGQAMHK